MLRNTNDYYVSVHRKKLYPHFHLHWCPMQKFFICLLQACSLLQHLLNTSNSQTKSIYLCFHPRVNSLPLKKSDRIWVEGGLTLVCSCPTMLVIMNHEVVENTSYSNHSTILHCKVLNCPKICHTCKVHTIWHVVKQTDQYLVDSFARPGNWELVVKSRNALFCISASQFSCLRHPLIIN